MSNPTVESNEVRAALTGRDPELALLRQAVADSDQGQGAAVFFTGEAGLGKTRLSEAAASEAAARHLRVLRGASDERTQNLAYGLFLGVLRDYLDDCSEEVGRQVRETIAALAPHLWDRLFGREAQPPALGEDDLQPELRQSLFLARLGKLLLDLAHDRGLMLCLEDLHWADSASLQVLRYLTHHGAAAPLMLLVTCELDSAARDVAVLRATIQDLQRHPHVQVCALQPLDETAINQLMASCFPGHGFSAGMARVIHFKSGGLPLLALQHLEHLRDQNILQQQDGLWVNQEQQSVESSEPESIRGTLRQRIERLSDEQQLVLAQAAIQGPTFAGRLVARTLSWPVSRVLKVLSQLMRNTRMLRVQDERFAFVHPLLAEVCSEFLDRETRRQAHLRLATILAKDRAEPEILAFHFLHAGALDQTLDHLLSTARRARTAFAYDEARRFLRQAQSVVDRLDADQVRAQRIEILLRLAEIEDRLGQLDEALALCRRVLAASTPEDGSAQAQVLMQMGLVHYRRGDWQQAIQLYQEALDRFGVLGDEERIATLHLRLGNIFFERGQLEQAAERFCDARAIATACNRHVLLGSIHGNLGVIASVRGQYVEAVLHYTDAFKAYREVEYLYGVCQTFHNLGMTHADQELWTKAVKCYDKAEELARKMGTVDLEANILISRAPALIALGDLDGAANSCRRALHHMQRLGDRLGVAECRKVEGMIHCQRDEYTVAQERLEEGRSLFAALDNPLGVAECDLELGRLLAECGARDEAISRLEQSSRTFTELGADDDARRADAMSSALAT